mgnify:CR=1 FL=1
MEERKVWFCSGLPRQFELPWCGVQFFNSIAQQKFNWISFFIQSLFFAFIPFHNFSLYELLCWLLFLFALFRGAPWPATAHNRASSSPKKAINHLLHKEIKISLIAELGRPAGGQLNKNQKFHSSLLFLFHCSTFIISFNQTSWLNEKLNCFILLFVLPSRGAVPLACSFISLWEMRPQWLVMAASGSSKQREVKLFDWKRRQMN